LAKCQTDLLPVPYFHVVFTLPHELSALALGNRALLYRLLFESASETLLEVAADPKHLGARIGALMVLHTWGQQLEHHPHVHCVVPGGGLEVPAAETPRWLSCRSNWFLPVRVLGRVFRGKYLVALRAAYQAGLLQFAASTLPLANSAAWRNWIRALYQKDWVVYAKEPFGGPEQMLKYLTGYTHRVALSNYRLVKLENNRVTFTWKDYANGCTRKEMTLDAVEFVRRFALHIVPKGLVRIRRYGLLAHRDRRQRLALCRSLLAARAEPAMASEDHAHPLAPTQDHPTTELSAAEPKLASSRLGLGVLAALISLGVSSGATAQSALPVVAPLAAVTIENLCPDCGLGHPRTFWRAGRPSREQLQRIPIWNSS
jgi:hypothetical protein